MSQLIVKFDNQREDVQLCSKVNDEIIFKNVSMEALMDLLIKNFTTEGQSEEIRLLDEQIIAKEKRYVAIKQPECKKIVFFEGKGSYKINFPNSIYIILFHVDKIKKIKAFAYKEYKGEDTELYEYPMPNMLGDNEICMGNSIKKIRDNDYVGALERVIATQYTHMHFSGIKGFSNSIKWFEYLEKNPFPYKLLKPLNYTLEKVEI